MILLPWIPMFVLFLMILCSWGPLAAIRCHQALLGRPLASLWVPPGVLWVPFGSLWVPFASLWPPLGFSWSPHWALLAAHRLLFGSLCSPLAASCASWPPFGRPWPHLACPPLAAPGRLWPSLVAPGRPWPPLGAPGRSWPPLVAASRPWPLLEVNKVLCPKGPLCRQRPPFWRAGYLPPSRARQGAKEIGEKS